MPNPNDLLYQQLVPQAMGQNPLSPQQMLLQLILNGQTPAKFGKGGEVASKALGPAIAGYYVYPDAKNAYESIKSGKHIPSSLGTLADSVGSVLSLPYYVGSTLLGSSDVGAGTLDEPEEPTLSGALAQYLLSLGNK